MNRAVGLWRDLVLSECGDLVGQWDGDSCCMGSLFAEDWWDLVKTMACVKDNAVAFTLKAGDFVGTVAIEDDRIEVSVY